MRRVVAAVVLLVLLALLGACSKDRSFSELSDPGKVTTIPAMTTSTEPDMTGVPLNPVAGNTTTSVVLGPGPMMIVGVVEGPGGVVPDAVVQLERLVGDGVATTRVPTAADGTWNLADVLGGRYRIRAWRTPDLATTKPEVVFIESGPQRSVSLRLDTLGGIRVDAAIAPDPPTVDQTANLKVRVAERTVDGEGIVRDTPRAGDSVALGGSGDWELDSPSPSFTGADGSVTFRVTCRDSGPQPLFATLADGQGYALVLPSCVEPATTSTTNATTSTTRPSSSSTTEPAGA